MFLKVYAIHVVKAAFPKPFLKTNSVRLFLSARTLRNENSIFGDLTKAKENESNVKETEQHLEASEIFPANDRTLQEYYLDESKKNQISIDKYITPLKRKLFEVNVSQNGFYKNNQVVKDPESKKTYRLSLTEREIDFLEPSIYLQSFRIKSSVKKANLVARFIRKYKVKNAINQLHFNPKKMATEMEKFLKSGLEQARLSKLNEDELYIQSLWVGSDGSWRKRVDIKGRGRMGIIEHPYIHLKAILRTEQTKLRRAWELQQKKTLEKPRMFLNNEPLNFKVRPYFKW